MGRLVVVSNRVPLPTEKGPQAGGLAVALADALTPGSLWFGWSGRRGARPPHEPNTQSAGGITYATIDLSENEYQRFYAGFANRVLWPLLHFELGLVHYRAEDYRGYRAVNRRFAASLARLLRSDDLVWVHDYHLMPLGAELRTLGVRNRLGFFLHTPFVPPAVWQALPHADAILEAMCAYDVIGFHTERYRAAFLDCVRQLLELPEEARGCFGVGDRTCQAIVDPIGIDADAFARMATQAERGLEAQRMRTSLGDRTLIIGVDRLDYSKGLINRMEAYGGLLGRYPEHLRQVNFLQIAARSREDVKEYRALGEELNGIAGDTNGRFSEFDWTPLRYMTRPVRRRTLAGFYRRAGVAVVTPLRDGMNLVAKEYVAAQNPADPGVLVLSRFAGAAEEMADALVVNPFDTDELTDAMHQALTMGLEERQARYRGLRDHVWHSTARRYCEVFLECLSAPTASAVLQPTSA